MRIRPQFAVQRRLPTLLCLAAALVLGGGALGACARSASLSRPAPAGSPITSFLTEAEVREGWRSLLSLDQWRGYRSDTLPTGWTVLGDTMRKTGVSDDIVTRREYTHFELAFDWKLDEGGNSGVFYRASEEYEKIYWSGPEYALLDDANHRDGRSTLTSAGAAHSLHAAPRGVVKAAGEWNSTRIVVRGTHVEHWLNGTQVATFEFGSPDFLERVAGSKFGRWPAFGKSASGLIGIQGDHRGVLELRRLRIREFAS